MFTAEPSLVDVPDVVPLELNVNNPPELTLKPDGIVALELELDTFTAIDAATDTGLLPDPDELGADADGAALVVALGSSLVAKLCWLAT